MRHQRVRWLHDRTDEPIVIYSEIDVSGRERRKVEEYSDGRLDPADAVNEHGTTSLSDERFPKLEEINSDPQFDGEPITSAEFEAVWTRAWTMVGRPTTFEEARGAVRRLVAQMSLRWRRDLVVPDEWIDDEGWCWVFGFNSRAWFETRSFRDMLVGTGPLVVEKKTGRIHLLGSAQPVDVQLKGLRRK